MEHYWLAYCNDGVELYGKKRNTRAEAIRDCKAGFKDDWQCAGGKDPMYEYYVEEFLETGDEVIVLSTQYFEMTMGPRGGVHCKLTRRE